MQRLYGSDDLFPDDRERHAYAYSPRQSVNYIASHDGFSLYDLTAYTRRRNEANGHQNTDGPAEEISFNCGTEGDDGAPTSVIEQRVRHAAALVCLLLLSAGSPMIRMGDESSRRNWATTTPTTRTTPPRGSIGPASPVSANTTHLCVAWPPSNTTIHRCGTLGSGKIGFGRFGPIGAVDLNPRSRELGLSPARYPPRRCGRFTRPLCDDQPGARRPPLRRAGTGELASPRQLGRGLFASEKPLDAYVESSVSVPAKSVVVLAGHAY